MCRLLDTEDRLPHEKLPPNPKLWAGAEGSASSEALDRVGPYSTSSLLAPSNGSAISGIE
jgi:hypothetical protein